MQNNLNLLNALLFSLGSLTFGWIQIPSAYSDVLPQYALNQEISFKNKTNTNEINTSKANKNEANQSVSFVPPSSSRYNLSRLADRGAPEGRQAAGTRGECSILSEPMDSMGDGQVNPDTLTALVPLVDITYNDDIIQIPIGLTTDTHPSFWFYVPTTSEIAHSMKFILTDQDEYPIFSVEVPPSASPSILSIKLPNSEPGLELNQDYHWFLSIDCQSSLEDDTAFETDIFVEGFVRRIELTPEQAASINQASPREKVELYASYGLWHNTIDELVELYRIDTATDIIERTFKSFLQSVGLEQFFQFF